MTVPPGPVRLPRLTLTFAAFDVAASSTTLNDTTSFFAPNVLMQWPSHTLLTTALACPVARSSSCVTLSPPSFAHTAVIDVVPEVPPVSAAQGSPASPPVAATVGAVGVRRRRSPPPSKPEPSPEPPSRLRPAWPPPPHDAPDVDEPHRRAERRERDERGPGTEVSETCGSLLPDPTRPSTSVARPLEGCPAGALDLPIRNAPSRTSRG